MGKKNKRVATEEKKPDNTVLSTELLQNKDETEAEKGDDRPPNTELKKRKKKQKKERTQDCQNPSLGDGNESEIAAGNASNRSGKKKQKKEKEEADKNVSNGNGSVKDQLVQNGFNGVPEGFEAATDGKTIVVSNIPDKIKERRIRKYFRGCGLIIQVGLSTFTDGGKPFRLAYVEFEREDAAKHALALDEPKFGDKSLKIELSKIRPKKKAAPTKVNGCKRAYIGNLPKVVDEDDIRQFFKESKIESVELALFHDSGSRCCGFGHISFADDESLENAMKKNNTKFCDRLIKVAYPVHKYLVPSKEKKKEVI